LNHIFVPKGHYLRRRDKTNCKRESDSLTLCHAHGSGSLLVPNNHSITSLKHIYIFTGVCGLLIGHPADTIKVRQQTFQSSGCIHIAIQTMKYEGVSLEVKGILNNKAS
jgi:hypothetical protein